MKHSTNTAALRCRLTNPCTRTQKHSAPQHRTQDFWRQHLSASKKNDNVEGSKEEESIISRKQETMSTAEDYDAQAAAFIRDCLHFDPTFSVSSRITYNDIHSAVAKWCQVHAAAISATLKEEEAEAEEDADDYDYCDYPVSARESNHWPQFCHAATLTSRVFDVLQKMPHVRPHLTKVGFSGVSILKKS